SRAVDVGAAATLGDRDQQSVLVLGIVAAKRVARADPLLRQAVEQLRHRCVEPQRELANDRRLVKQLDAVEPPKALPRVGGPANQQLAELDEAALAEPGEVDHSA